LLESAAQRIMAGKPLLKLNIARRPIANKYGKGKVKSRLKRPLKRA